MAIRKNREGGHPPPPPLKIMTDSLAQRLGSVLERLKAALRSAGRNEDDATLVAVSKRHPAALISEARAAGQLAFGENYAQEMVAKIDELSGLQGLEFHYIGPLQTNKARLVTGNAALIHAVDRAKVLRVVSRLAVQRGVEQQLLFEVHLSHEDSKAGCLPEALPALVQTALELPGIRPRGLMTMPPFFADPEKSRPYFSALRALRDDLSARFELADFDHLSMGMSHDFEVAVAEGATLVRVGAAIFGPRP